MTGSHVGTYAGGEMMGILQWKEMLLKQIRSKK